MTTTLRAGAHQYNALPPSTFDADWNIGQEAALRYFSRACETNGGLVSHKPCGQPDYEVPRKVLYSRKDYLAWAYSDEQKAQTNGCYFSPNLFYQWRRQSHLKGLCANWVDIDIRGHVALSAIEREAVYDEITTTLWESQLPMPTCLVLTGSGGVHLYWRYTDPVMTLSAKHRTALLEHWNLLNRRLVTVLEKVRKRLGFFDWSVDPSASNNPSGYMRLPGSVHPKTGQVVQYLRGTGETFEFATLGKALGLKAPAPDASKFGQTSQGASRSHLTLPAGRGLSFVPGSVQRGSPVTENPHNEREDGVAQGYDSPGQRHQLQSIMVQWETHLKATGGLRPKSGRDLTVFHLYNCARRIMSADKAWDYIERINSRYVHYTDHQLRAYLGTAMKRIYYYGIPTLLQALRSKLNLHFKVGSARKRLTPDEVLERQSQAGQRTSQHQRERTLRQLVDDLKRLLTPGRRTSSLRKAEALQHSQLSRATLYRYWDAAIRELKQQEIAPLGHWVAAVKKCINRSPSSYNLVEEDPLNRSLVKFTLVTECDEVSQGGGSPFSGWLPWLLHWVGPSG